jgi:hypothetical protein
MEGTMGVEGGLYARGMAGATGPIGADRGYIGMTGCIGAGDGVKGRGVYICGPDMLAPVGGKGLDVYTLDPGSDENVDGRGTTSPRPANAPGCGAPRARDGGFVRANETARGSGATRWAGMDEVGTRASPMLGPRVIVYDVCAAGAALGLAAM